MSVLVLYKEVALSDCSELRNGLAFQVFWARTLGKEGTATLRRLLVQLSYEPTIDQAYWAIDLIRKYLPESDYSTELWEADRLRREKCEEIFNWRCEQLRYIRDADMPKTEPLAVESATEYVARVKHVQEEYESAVWQQERRVNEQANDKQADVWIEFLGTVDRVIDRLVGDWHR